MERRAEPERHDASCRKKWRQRSKDTEGMLALCVEEEKTEKQAHDGAESGAGAT